MSQERRTEALCLKFKASVAEEMRADARREGQKLVEYIERAVINRLRKARETTAETD